MYPTPSRSAHPANSASELKMLKQTLTKQLEYYFSRENLKNDAYLLAQMDSDQYVPIWIVANFNLVKKLTKDIKLITEVLRESPKVEVDKKGLRVRPSQQRCTIILREIPESKSVDVVKGLFNSEKCPRVNSCESAGNNSWYVTFGNDEDAQKAFKYLREDVKQFEGKPIKARMKALPVLSRDQAAPKTAKTKTGRSTNYVVPQTQNQPQTVTTYNYPYGSTQPSYFYPLNPIGNPANVGQAQFYYQVPVPTILYPSVRFPMTSTTIPTTYLYQASPGPNSAFGVMPQTPYTPYQHVSSNKFDDFALSFLQLKPYHSGMMLPPGYGHLYQPLVQQNYRVYSYYPVVQNPYTHYVQQPTTAPYQSRVSEATASTKPTPPQAQPEGGPKPATRFPLSSSYTTDHSNSSKGSIDHSKQKTLRRKRGINYTSTSRSRQMPPQQQQSTEEFALSKQNQQNMRYEKEKEKEKQEVRANHIVNSWIECRLKNSNNKNNNNKNDKEKYKKDADAQSQQKQSQSKMLSVLDNIGKNLNTPTTAKTSDKVNTTVPNNNNNQLNNPNRERNTTQQPQIKSSKQQQLRQQPVYQQPVRPTSQQQQQQQPSQQLIAKTLQNTNNAPNTSTSQQNINSTNATNTSASIATTPTTSTQNVRVRSQQQHADPRSRLQHQLSTYNLNAYQQQQQQQPQIYLIHGFPQLGCYFLPIRELPAYYNIYDPQ